MPTARPPAGRRTVRAAVAGALVMLAGAWPAPAPAAPRGAIVYTSPHAGARWVHPETGLLVRFGAALDPAALPALDVRGTTSGPHAGRTALADDGRTLRFAPGQPFAAGEAVTVTVSAPDGASSAFSFTTAAVRPRVDPLRRLAPEDAPLDPLARVSAFSALALSSPATVLGDTLDLGVPLVTTNLYATPATGRLFMCSFPLTQDPSIPSYLLILDDDGRTLFARPTPLLTTDFKEQPNGWLTYCDGVAGKFYAMDSTYTVVDSFACGNGYGTDLHELRLLPNGHALLLGTEFETVDMSALVSGGNPAATVMGNVIQELDADKNVVFEWRSFDHFEITDATLVDLTAPDIDAVHSNALELDNDGNLLLSSRHLDEITKIDHTTGDVIWRWGGKHNQFTLVGDDVPFSHQHAIRRLPNGHVTLFDNGNGRVPPYSRALEYALDEPAKTATLVWQFRNVPDTYSFAMGYVQRLANGSTLIGWGTGKPDAIEVAPDGSKVMELSLPAAESSYRVFRQDWAPASSVADQGAPVALTLSSSWPNPARASSVFYLSLSAPTTVSVSLFDVRGRRLRSVLDRAPRNAGVYRVPLDLSGVRSGVYLLRAVTSLGTREQRFVHLR